MRIAFSFIVAVLVPTLLVTAFYLFDQFTRFPADDPYIWIRTAGFLHMTLAVVITHAVILGVPVFLLLWKLKLIRWWSTIGTGFVVGALPSGILLFLTNSMVTTAHVNGVLTIDNGELTPAGWFNFASSVSYMGAWGATGAAGFWLVWYILKPQQGVQPDRARRRVRLT